jgi:TPR repeat protein
MTHPPINAPKAAPQKNGGELSHQERVYFEMFRAIEQLGRKLEKAEAERYILSRRLADIESGAARDETTGRFYLPARIEPAAGEGPRFYPAAQRFALPAALASLVLALLTLGAVLLQDMPQRNALQAQGGAGRDALPVRLAVAPETLAGKADGVEIAPALLPSSQGGANLKAMMETAGETLLPAAPDAEQQAAVQVAEQEERDTAAGQAETAALPAAPFLTGGLASETLAADSAFAVDDVSGDATAGAALAQESAVAPKEQIKEQIQEEKMPESAPSSSVQALKEPSVRQSAVLPMRDPRLPQPLLSLETQAFEGFPEAQHDLAALYADGRRVRQDYVRARAWFTRAAEAGLANAHYNLGVMSQRGLGAPADEAAARTHYERAALRGHAEALYNLGLMHAEGLGVSKNAARAASYFKRAANAGLVQAAYNLGVMYESDTLGKPDIAAAIEWYEVAAGEGNREASLALRRLTRQRAQQAGVAPQAAPSAR